MEIKAQVSGSLAAILKDEVRAGEIAVSAVIGQISSRLKSDWRGQIASAGLGRRLSNAVRSEVYPKARPSLNAAGLVYSAAPEITQAFEQGAVIRSRDGFWLAIPLPAAGRGLRGGKITPGEWERRTGRRLKLIFRPGRPGLLVDDGTVPAGSRAMRRDGFSRAVRGFSNRTVPMFTLVPQVKLAKRLSLMASADRLAGSLAAGAAARWR